jgi:beta-N-acetylhexosaminidase
MIYFSWTGNLQEPQQIADLSDGLQTTAKEIGYKTPLLISTDQETGIVTRIGKPLTLFPGNQAMGAARSLESTQQVAQIIGEEIKVLGINMNLAPDADVNINPGNPIIGVRSFGSNPQLVSEMIKASVKGLDKAGVATTLKHFPGHGDTNVDSHTGLPVINHSVEELKAIDFPPFQAGISLNVDSIMTAHIIVPALEPNPKLPSTLSYNILTKTLRESLGFKGVIITDSLSMAGVRQSFPDDQVALMAIKAGADLLLMPPNTTLAFNAIKGALNSGVFNRSRLEESVIRTLQMKYRRGLDKWPVKVSNVLKYVGTPEHQNVSDSASDLTVTMLKNDKLLVPIPEYMKKVYITGYAPPAFVSVDNPNFDETNAPFALSEIFKSFGYQINYLNFSSSPTPDDISNSVEGASTSDIAIVLTGSAWKSANSLQRDLVSAVQQTGTPTIVVGIADPYDIAYLGNVSTYLCTYAYTASNIGGLARALAGKSLIQGKLPVTIPDSTGKELFAYGFGISSQQAIR